MSVKIKAVQKKNPQKPTEPAKWYPQAIGTGETNLNDLALYASGVSTVSKADILAVLETVFEKAGKDLAEGKIVRIGEHFTLQISVTGMPSEKENEVNGTKVKSAHILFRPGKALSDMLKLLTFKK